MILFCTYFLKGLDVGYMHTYVQYEWNRSVWTQVDGMLATLCVSHCVCTY